MTSRIVNNLKVSPSGLDFIKRHEGLRLKLYRDLAGHQTIGYGHKLTKREIGKLITITKAQAETLLMGDVWIPQMYVNATARVPLTQNQFDALVSFAFNLGVGALDTSSLLRFVQAGNFVAAAAEFEKWDNFRDPKTKKLIEAPGLKKRRLEEKALFLKIEKDDVYDRN